MNEAFEVFVHGIVFGFGLSLVVGFLGSAIGRLLAIFDI